MRVKPAEPRHTFSVYLPTSLYQKLVNKAGMGKLNTFIKQVLEKELTDDNEQKLEQKLIADYKSVAQNQARKKEDELWDETTDDGL